MIENETILSEVVPDSVIDLWYFRDIEFLCFGVVDVLLEFGPSVVHQHDILTFSRWMYRYSSSSKL